MEVRFLAELDTEETWAKIPDRLWFPKQDSFLRFQPLGVLKSLGEFRRLWDELNPVPAIRAESISLSAVDANLEPLRNLPLVY